MAISIPQAPDWDWRSARESSVPMAAVERGLALLDSGCDIAIASRALRGSRVVHHQNVWRELSAKLYTLIQNAYLGFRYRDTQCGFKWFPGGLARDLAAAQRLEGFAFDVELLGIADSSEFGPDSVATHVMNRPPVGNAA